MTTASRRIELLPLDDLHPAPRNPKLHDPSIGTSLDRFGYVEAIALDERTGRLVAGHGRLDQLKAKRDAGETPPEGLATNDDGAWLVPVQRGWASKDDDEAEAYLLASNQTSTAGGWDTSGLDVMLDELRGREVDLAGLGFDSLPPVPDSDGSTMDDPEADSKTLAERFLVPPFSVLDARQGYWQDRKRAWLALGIESEVGRPHNLLKMNDPAYYWKKQEAEKQAGRQLSNAEFEADWFEADAYVGGTSIFDPVLCEIAYRWFSPVGGLVLDPFAGGSVRGVTAAWLGRRYVGIELREEQVAVNREQADKILGADGAASWVHADAAVALDPAADALGPADLLFSCPPYFDLEVYSDEPGDLSNAPDYDTFLAGYSTIIERSLAQLAADRFAVWVVGEIRGKDGAIRNLVPDTIRAFEAAGASLQSDAVLITAVGSLALRAARIFGGARRLARGHQYVLIFCKGDPAKATAACGAIEVASIDELFGDALTIDEEVDDDGSPAACPDRA